MTASLTTFDSDWALKPATRADIESLKFLAKSDKELLDIKIKAIENRIDWNREKLEWHIAMKLSDQLSSMVGWGAFIFLAVVFVGAIFLSLSTKVSRQVVEVAPSVNAAAPREASTDPTIPMRAASQAQE